MNIVEETIINIFKLPKLDEYGKIIYKQESDNKSRSTKRSISKKNKKKIGKKFTFKIKFFKKKSKKKTITKSQSPQTEVILSSPYLNNIPSNSFGVFVTIHRENDKLQSYPNDVHGCIGNWDNKYKNVLPEKIYRDIMDVSLKATFEDDRRKSFPPLENDVFSRVEISYLLTPLYTILTKKFNNKIIGWIDKLQKEFNNKEFGLILNGPSRATYLPDVFENSSWVDIKKSLLEKAGLGPEQEHQTSFYAYLSKVEKESIFGLIYNKINYNNSYPRQIANCFIKFSMVSASNNIIPYSVSSMGDIQFKNEEIIQNLNLIQTLLNINEPNLNHTDFNELIDLLLKYLKNIYEKIDKINGKELATLIITIFKLNTYLKDNISHNHNHEFLFPIDEKYIQTILSKLKTTDRWVMILAILSYYDYSKEQFNKEILDFSKEIIKMYMSESDSSIKPTNETVLNFNYDLQVLCKMYESLDNLNNEVKIISNKNNRRANQNSLSVNDQPRMELKSDIDSLLKKKLKIFIDLLKEESLEQLNNLESNILSSLFNSLMMVFKHIDPRKLFVEASIAFKLFLILMSRFKPENGLIYSKTNEAIIETTCQFLNSF